MDILRQLLPRAQQVEVVELQRQATTVDFEANRFKASRVEETSGLAVRVVRDGRIGFSASSDARRLERLVDNVLESAAFGEDLHLAFPAPQAASPVQAFDDTIATLPVERLGELGAWPQVIKCALTLADGGVWVASVDPSRRAVRGGSWGGDQRDARCAVRYRVGPDDFNDDIGFRVVVSLANSDS